MRTTIRRGFLGLIILQILAFALAQTIHAQLPPGFTNIPPLASWTLQDTNHWKSDQGYAPISFTNILWSNLGDGHSLVVNTSGVPAFLDYYIIEPANGPTNFVLSPSGGSLTFWFAPVWSSGTNGGTGPGQLAQLISVGELDSSAGYRGLSASASGSNIVFESQDGSGHSYSLSAPINWTSNFFHFIALTTSSTNVSLYLDGQLATNDSGGLSVWPLSGIGSVWFGSDTNGEQQAQGLFNSVQTFNSVLNSTNIQQIYDTQAFIYGINPYNIPYLITPAPSEPSYAPTYQAVTGEGNLMWLSNVDNCADASEYDVRAIHGEGLQENIVGRYMYGPFGKLIGQWGPMASVNEMQFSSMPHDNFSGLSFYPFRAYEPNFQRWLNQDPIQEWGGINLGGGPARQLPEYRDTAGGNDFYTDKQ